MKLPAASCGYQSGIAPKLTRLRPSGLQRGSPRHSSLQHTLRELQGILAKANKNRTELP